MPPSLAPPALEPPAGLPAVAPPWTLSASSWIFPHWTSPSHISSQRSASCSAAASSASSLAQRQGLDAGSYAPREVLYSGAEADVFKGGLGGWIIYRYTSSPVGPYDELIHVAGSFASAETGLTTLRITNIYVSTDVSVWNGRRNWNIPKHRAVFCFDDDTSSSSSAGSGGATTVRISHPHRAASPFFAARLAPRRWSPSLPVRPWMLPTLALLGPPLLTGAYESEGTKQVVVQSQPEAAWRISQPTFRGSMRLAAAEPMLDGAFGDGESFAKLQRTWCSFGFYFPQVTVTFPLALEVGPGARKAEQEGGKTK